MTARYQANEFHYQDIIEAIATMLAGAGLSRSIMAPTRHTIEIDRADLRAVDSATLDKVQRLIDGKHLLLQVSVGYFTFQLPR